MVSTTEEVVAVEVQQPVTEVVEQISADDWDKAQKTFQLGKKNLFLNKYDESVNNIDEACKVYSAKYGEIDPKCAEVYFFYGRALLELARVENNVLGNALEGVPEESEPINDSRYGDPDKVDSEEQKDIEEKVIDAMCETREVVKTTENGDKKTEEVNVAEDATKAITENGDKKTEEVAEVKAESKTEEKVSEVKAEETKVVEMTEDVKVVEKTENVKVVEKTEETKVVEMTEEAKTEEVAAVKTDGKTAEDAEEEEEEEEDAEEEAEGEATEENKDEAESEEISSLQRAWEMFELAKLIYSKHFDEDTTFKNKRISECLIKLGEISIEQEVYEQAITDITESLRIQEELKCTERDERMLAESYYQLGLAQQFNNQFSEARESFQKSINIMQMRVEKLRAKLTTLTEDETAEKTTCSDEITDLEALLPEMNSKLEELAEQSEQTKTLVKECFESASAPGPASATNGEVKDITSMVKSKRKISSSNIADTDTTDECSKKTRLSSTDGEKANVEITNGTAAEKTNGTDEVVKTDEVVVAKVEASEETPAAAAVEAVALVEASKETPVEAEEAMATEAPKETPAAEAVAIVEASKETAVEAEAMATETAEVKEVAAVVEKEEEMKETA